MTEVANCKHEKTRLIAKDNEAEYIECVACGAILETHELRETEPLEIENQRQAAGQSSEKDAVKNPETDSAKPGSFDESLSDA